MRCLLWLKKAEFVTFGDHTFKVVAHKDRRAYYNHSHGYRTLDDCYKRPSETKRGIYEAWKKYFNDTFGSVGTHSGVLGYNCNFFSFGCTTMIWYNNELVDAEFYITYTRHEVVIYDL